MFCFPAPFAHISIKFINSRRGETRLMLSLCCISSAYVVVGSAYSLINMQMWVSGCCCVSSCFLPSLPFILPIIVISALGLPSSCKLQSLNAGHQHINLCMCVCVCFCNLFTVVFPFYQFYHQFVIEEGCMVVDFGIPYTKSFLKWKN